MTARKRYTAAEVEIVKAKTMLTPREAAFISGVSNSHLYDLWHEGAGPASLKIGRSRRIRRVDLDTWIAAGLKAAKK
jgi:excisionase family DNA binding protein